MSRTDVQRPFAAMAWMLLASALFAVMNLAAKRALHALPWHEVAVGRAFFGGLTIYAVARARGAPLGIHDRKTQWARSLCGLGAMCSGFYALAHMPLGDSVTLVQLSPLFVAVLSTRFLGERAGVTLLLAIVLGLGGVALVAGAHLTVGLTILPALVGVGAAIFSAAAMIFLRRLGPRESPEGVSLHFVCVSAVGAFLLGLGRQVVPAPLELAALVVAGLAGGLAQITMTRAYGLDKAARVGAIGYAGIVMSQLLGVLFLDEIPTWKQLLGAAFVLASGACLVASAVREDRTAPRELEEAQAGSATS